MSISEKVIEILKKIQPEFEYTPDLDLIEQGVLDSFDMIIFTVELEKEFKIKIPGTEINSKNFKSVNSISNYISGFPIQK